VSKPKLLLADDSATIQKVVNLTFADEGIEVIGVGDGDTAMERFSEIRPDIVLADVNMPGLSGYEVCETIRRRDDGGNTL
jgi:Response regulator containing CheY-like receiver, AAA-type ATPase, and DNA-binding domains